MFGEPYVCQPTLFWFLSVVQGFEDYSINGVVLIIIKITHKAEIINIIYWFLELLMIAQSDLQ